jgi:hypothetical protein
MRCSKNLAFGPLGVQKLGIRTVWRWDHQAFGPFGVGSYLVKCHQAFIHQALHPAILLYIKGFQSVAFGTCIKNMYSSTLIIAFLLWIFSSNFVYYFGLCRPSESNLQFACQTCRLPNKEWHVPAGWSDAGFEPRTSGVTVWCITIEPTRQILLRHLRLLILINHIRFLILS